MGKSLIKQRKEAGAVCSICKSPDYQQLDALILNGKPLFKCNSCGNQWMYGWDGGMYATLNEMKANG